ncbi:MAG: mannose-1-phosphate guanylyltransferase/mannose-6-phosphate isomerase [Endomicrobia bacterium]|nr:mannose-1-phosphate guanylyltransferase/mannose-6-phosphate isomerase [Endomicrobiia bacterium]
MISIILAGGAGTRLWPLSRKFWPKFLLKLGNNKHSLLQQTFLRVNEITPTDKIFIVVNREHKFLVKENIQDIKINFPLENIIIEPDIKNTLPAITLACSVINQRYNEDEVVGIFPSDHIIKPQNKFNEYVVNAQKIAKIGKIVLFGITPYRIETGYGHIKVGAEVKGEGSVFGVKCLVAKNKNLGIVKVYEVKEFIEKPQYELAKKLIKTDCVYWNSGIFVFNIRCFFEELKTYQHKIYQLFTSWDFKEESLEKIYNKLHSISIDKGLIEKTKKLVLMPLKGILWDDLGSFNSLDRIYKKAKNQNIVLANSVGIKSKNLTIVGNNRMIATCGLKDLIIVDTEDALLVVDKKYDQEVKTLVRKIKDETILYHKTTQRPWGCYTVLKETKGYKVKIINVLPKKRLSLQKHLKRAEQWFVVSGIAKITFGNKVVYLKKGETLKIERNVPHRLENPSKTKILEIIEVAYGKYLAEDDIIRLEDDFGRK